MAAAAVSRWHPKAGKRSWAGRTLRIVVSPSPLSFAERRSVLQILQRQGTIETFKMDPNYHDQFIAVAKTQETTDKLLESSPLSYTIDSPHESLDINYIDLARPDHLDGTKATVNPGGEISKEEQGGQAHKRYELGIMEAPEFNHTFTMTSSPLHGPWPAEFTNRESLSSSILKQTLPHNMARPGLARWDYNSEQAVPTSKKEERHLLARCLPSKIKRQMEQPDSDEPE